MCHQLRRAQRDGVAITFVSDMDMRYFGDIERFLERDIHKNPLPEGLGEGPEYRASAPRNSSRGRGGRRRGGKNPKAQNKQNGQDPQQKKRHHHGGKKKKNTTSQQ